MMDCACRTCTKHGVDPNCHSTCPEYKEYEARLKEYREKRYKNKLKAQALDEVSNRGKRKMFKTDRGHRWR